MNRRKRMSSRSKGGNGSRTRNNLVRGPDSSLRIAAKLKKENPSSYPTNYELLANQGSIKEYSGHPRKGSPTHNTSGTYYNPDNPLETQAQRLYLERSRRDPDSRRGHL